MNELRSYVVACTVHRFLSVNSELSVLIKSGKGTDQGSIMPKGWTLPAKGKSRPYKVSDHMKAVLGVDCEAGIC